MRTLFMPEFPKDFPCWRTYLVTSAARLGDDTLKLVDLSLGTAEGTEL